jgi:hypothetical protein
MYFYAVFVQVNTNVELPEKRWRTSIRRGTDGFFLLYSRLTEAGNEWSSRLCSSSDALAVEHATDQVPGDHPVE